LARGTLRRSILILCGVTGAPSSARRTVISPRLVSLFPRGVAAIATQGRSSVTAAAFNDLEKVPDFIKTPLNRWMWRLQKNDLESARNETR
jgi:hypothetical protein